MKKIKLVIALVILVLIGFLAYRLVLKNDTVDEARLEEMKQSIITDPVVQVDDLSEDQLSQFLNRFETAKEALIGFNFDHLQSVNDIAVIKKSLGDIDGAITAWEYANIIRPNNSLSFSNLAVLYHFTLQDFDKAEENYLASIANDPDDIPTIRNFYELYHFGTETHDPDDRKAEALLLAAIETNPNAADLYSLAGSFYSDIGQNQKAIEMFERHLDLNPGNRAVINAIEQLRQAQ